MKAFLIGDKSLSDRLLGNDRVQAALFNVMDNVPNGIVFGVLASAVDFAFRQDVQHAVEYGFMLFAGYTAAMGVMGAARTPVRLPPEDNVDVASVVPQPQSQAPEVVREVITPSSNPPNLKFKMGPRNP